MPNCASAIRLSILTLIEPFKGGYSSFNRNKSPLFSKHSVNPVFVPSYFGVTFTTKKLCGISNRLKLSIPVTRVAV